MSLLTFKNQANNVSIHDISKKKKWTSFSNRNYSRTQYHYLHYNVTCMDVYDDSHNRHSSTRGGTSFPGREKHG